MHGVGTGPTPITTSPAGTRNQTHRVATITRVAIILGEAHGGTTTHGIVVTTTHGQITIVGGITAAIFSCLITVGHNVIIYLISQFQQRLPSRTSQVPPIGQPIRLACTSHPKETIGKE